MSRAAALLVLLTAVACGAPPRATRPVPPPRPAPVAQPAPDTARPDRPPAPALRLGTWNVRRLGHGDKDLARVAEVIDEFDVVALQEVMTPEGARALLDHLPAGWRLVVTEEPVGRTAYREHYALLYRQGVVRLTRWFVLDDPDDVFERDPMVACLEAGELDFCLVSIHVIYGRRVGPRDDEIRALVTSVERLRAGGAEKDWLLVGDFNRPGSAPSWRQVGEQGWRFCDDTGATRTTIGRSGYASAYDHIVLDRGHTGEWDGTQLRVDVLSTLCGGDAEQCRQRISDHAPLGTAFRIEGPDDD